MTELAFDHLGRARLDGVWDFFPGEHEPAELARLEPEPIAVPGLWEAQGYLELDGEAWYRRRFELDDVRGHWTLRFGAVMDIADVHFNGAHLGSNESPFTPFELDARESVREGPNELLVRVVDPSIDDPRHIRMPHGKQGWANWVFPSRPSLYMTYGGIWQPVVLRRHGPVVVRDVFVNGDPDDLRVWVEVENRADEEIAATLNIRLLGGLHLLGLTLPPRSTQSAEAKLGPTSAVRWSPQRPALHEALVDAVVEGTSSDTRSVRFGLRTVRVEGTRVFLNDEPYRMRSALVQGFAADGLYAEGPRAEIEAEVRAALDMGFNTLRLHIKAFDPLYLDVCDELGMLLHCDIPVAEPIAHEELGDDTPLAERCIAAARAQVRRDRNHPSVILWSAMNELCYDRPEARQWEGYERFARAVAGAVMEADPTRPVIENDWAEPDPERVFVSPIETAHWYGRLHAEYLEELEARCARSADLGKPLFVTEFGDWGLPDMPRLESPPFWDTHDVYAAGLASTLWPASVDRFVTETQRYQGLSDRLQIEVFRRHGHIGGYCVTELTDVPHELNGLLDLRRRPKPIAVREVTRANQTVLPMLELDGLVVEAGEVLRPEVVVANDGPPLGEVAVEVRAGTSGGAVDASELVRVDASALPAERILARFDEGTSATRVARLAPHRPTRLGPVEVVAPDVPGSHDLVVRLSSKGRFVAENRYPIHVVARPAPVGEVTVAPGGSRAAEAIRSVGGSPAPDGPGPLVVGEGALAEGAAAVRAALGRGGTVLILAQDASAAPDYPIPVEIADVETAWGSSVFHFTNDVGALQSLPRRNVLVAEDSTIQAHSVVTLCEGRPFPRDPAVLAYKPTPGSITGTIVGAHPAGGGRMLFCQYRLERRALGGDAAARALLADLIAWARTPDPVVRAERRTMPDGRRAITYYSRGGSRSEAE